MGTNYPGQSEQPGQPADANAPDRNLPTLPVQPPYPAPPPQPPAYPPPPPQPAYQPPAPPAPTYPPPVQAPPQYPQQQPYPQPYPQQYPPQPAAPKSRRTTWLVLGMVVAIILVLGGGGAVLGNFLLSKAYGPEQAVTDYFGAQGRADVGVMMSGATYLRGDATWDGLFSRSALDAMMAIPQNADVKNVKVVSTKQVDSKTSAVNVSMTWNGQAHNQSYNVVQDLGQSHFLFYHSWRVQVPFVTVHVTTPKQAGQVQLDGISPPSSVTDGTIEAVQGYHKVSMGASAFYDSASQDVDGVATDAPTATFPNNLSAGATSLAAASVKEAFTHCDSSKYLDCPGKSYKAPNTPGYVYYLTMPGYGKIYYTSYKVAFTSDPTTSMKLAVSAEADHLVASGSCGLTLTVNGSAKYLLKGAWTADLTWESGSFVADVLFSCASAKA